MFTRSSRTLVGWMPLLAVVLAAAASGAEPALLPVPPHPLVVATEKVCRKDLSVACEEMAKLARASPGLTDDDSIGLLWMEVLRSFGRGDENAARRGLAQVLDLDRSAQPPPDAPARLGELLADARARLPSGALPGDERSRHEKAMKAAREREPEAKVLLRAATALYEHLEVEGTAIIIDQARFSAPPAAADRAQVSSWLGVLKMESEPKDEDGARALFREALEADGEVGLPNNVPMDALRLFLEVKAATLAPAPPRMPAVEPVQPVHSPPPPPVVAAVERPPSMLRTWGVAAGGAGAALVLGGAMAGAMAFSDFEAEQAAARSGDLLAYDRNHGATKRAVVIANGLYGAGALALGVGAVLFLSAPGEVRVGAAAGPGKASLAVEGSF